MQESSEKPFRLELWGGAECTVNRVGEVSYEQLHRSGHHARLGDLDLFASLGITALRYPVLWERTAPTGLDTADWTWPDERLNRLRELSVRPIVGLLHHGHGPADTSLIDPGFPDKFEAYAQAVAERYPWVDAYTPINEPLTTARFCGLYGIWYPHGRDDATFTRILLAQCKATVLAMKAIREVNPAAQLIQNEDIGKIHSTPRLAYEAEYQNERRWLTFDLLCGRVNPSHQFWEYFRQHGASETDLLWFVENACPPDMLGFDYYVTSERFLDHHVERYPADWMGGNGRDQYCDLTAAQVRDEGIDGMRRLLHETWDRFGIPIAVTEAHLGSTREEQLRWILEAWRGAEAARLDGVDVRAVTAWALLGLFDWNTLLTCQSGVYEPGPFDVRGPRPRATAIARLLRSLAAGDEPRDPVLSVPGWWHRPQRLNFGFTVSASGRMNRKVKRDESINHLVASSVQPLLIVGTGRLGGTFARLCDLRGIPFRLLDRAEMDITRPDSVRAALDLHRPWAVVNAAGYTGIDDAEADEARCYAENARGAGVVATECARRGLRLLTFSSDMVFGAATAGIRVESTPVSPRSVYGAAKLRAEHVVLRSGASALIVRPGPIFGPGRGDDELTRALRMLSIGAPVIMASDELVSPTYVPDLVNESLDLLIDGERGIWHLANRGETSPYTLVRQAASLVGISTGTLRGVTGETLRQLAQRPSCRTLNSERGEHLGSLEDALARYATECRIWLQESEFTTAGDPLHAL